MPHFDDVFIPDRHGYGSTGGPFWLRDVVTTAAGFVTVVTPWTEPLQRFAINIAPDEIDQIWPFVEIFEAIGGTLGSCLMRDWFNWNTTAGLMKKGDEVSIAFDDQPLQNTVTGGFTGDGTTTVFQAVQRFTVGSASRYRTVKKLSGLGPIGDQTKVGIDGVEQVSGWSQDNATGKITFTVAPGNGLDVTWGGAFYRPVTFEDDTFLQALVGGNVNEGLTVNLREVRLP